MKLLGIGDNVFDHYRWRKELYPGGNSVNVPVLAPTMAAKPAISA